MGSLGSPKTWVPYISTKDCSQGFCSLYCPQWCYIPAPPPPYFEFPDENSGPNFSPLVIAIIGILASAFLLVSYYTIISKYCGNMERERRENQDINEELEDNHNPALHEPWHVATTGLDEALIKSITLCKYKKGDGLVEGTDCSVCLSEFEEDESLRLLPKCSHAFHVQCIDTWLKFHSNCPLCRANIVPTTVPPTQLPPPVMESPLNNEPSQQSQLEHENVAVGEDLERVAEEEEIMRNEVIPKTPSRVFSDLRNSEERDTIIEIRDEGEQQIRRSISLDYSCQNRLSVADILLMNEDEDPQMGDCDCQFPGHVGSSKVAVGEISKDSHRNRVLHCVMSPVSMKRSFSSGRLLFTRHARGRDGIIPTFERRLDYS